MRKISYQDENWTFYYRILKFVNINFELILVLLFEQESLDFEKNLTKYFIFNHKLSYLMNQIESDEFNYL